MKSRAWEETQAKTIWDWQQSEQPFPTVPLLECVLECMGSNLALVNGSSCFSSLASMTMSRPIYEKVKSVRARKVRDWLLEEVVLFLYLCEEEVEGQKQTHSPGSIPFDWLANLCH